MSTYILLDIEMTRVIMFEYITILAFKYKHFHPNIETFLLKIEIFSLKIEMTRVD
jgi:hypothetical protein